MDQLITLRTLPVSALMQKDFAKIKGSCTVAEALQIMKKAARAALSLSRATKTTVTVSSLKKTFSAR